MWIGWGDDELLDQRFWQIRALCAAWSWKLLDIVWHAWFTKSTALLVFLVVKSRRVGNRHVSADEHVGRGTPITNVEEKAAVVTNMKSSPEEKSPRAKIAPHRRIGRGLAALLLLATIALVATAAGISYLHDLPLSKSLQAMGRQTLLGGTALAVELYDPCQPQLAALGPLDEKGLDWKKYVRVEEAFADTKNNRAIKLIAADNERIVRSDYPFRYQPYDEPRLHELRKRYQLDEVVAPAKDEFEQLVLLRNWCRSQFRRCDYQPFEVAFDALKVLDRNLRNETERPLDLSRDFDPCHFFPLLYCQVVVSMGHQGRLVSSNHGMTEVWSNQYGKWILMDAELNLHYEKDGVPLGTLELRSHIANRDDDQITVVHGEQTSGDVRPTLVHLKVETIAPGAIVNERTRFDIVELRNDWLTNYYFPGHPARSDLATLTYDDASVPEEFRVLYPLRPLSRDLRQFSWTLNQAEIYVVKPQEPEDARALEVAFRTVTPNFGHFEVVVDGDRPVEQQGSRFKWTLHPGENVLQVRPVNQFGVKGITSSVALHLPEGTRERP